MIDMLKRHAIQVLRRAGHSLPEAAKLAGVSVRSQFSIQDVDGDFIFDLMLYFRSQATGIQCGDTSALLTGQTLRGQRIEGIDFVRTVGCS